MKEMSFFEHLEELRKTLMRVAVIILISFSICYHFGIEITEWLLKPLRDILGTTHAGDIVYLNIFDRLTSELQVSLWSSIILAAPLLFFEIWRFLAPALYMHEKNAVKPFLVFGLFLFFAGVAFGYYVVFPFGFKIIFSYGIGNVKATIDLKDYLLSASQILVFMGGIFQVPNIMLILGFLGFITKYSLRKIRRYVYVALSIVAAIFSPPDAFSMVMIWIPLCILYEIGILAVAFIVHPYLERKFGTKANYNPYKKNDEKVSEDNEV